MGYNPYRKSGPAWTRNLLCFSHCKLPLLSSIFLNPKIVSGNLSLEGWFSSIIGSQSIGRYILICKLCGIYVRLHFLQEFWVLKNDKWLKKSIWDLTYVEPRCIWHWRLIRGLEIIKCPNVPGEEKHSNQSLWME